MLQSVPLAGGRGEKRYEHPKMVVSQRMKKKVERGWVGCEKWESLQQREGGSGDRVFKLKTTGDSLIAQHVSQVMRACH